MSEQSGSGATTPPGSGLDENGYSYHWPQPDPGAVSYANPEPGPGGKSGAETSRSVNLIGTGFYLLAGVQLIVLLSVYGAYAHRHGADYVLLAFTLGLGWLGAAGLCKVGRDIRNRNEEGRSWGLLLIGLCLLECVFKVATGATGYLLAVALQLWILYVLWTSDQFRWH